MRRFGIETIAGLGGIVVTTALISGCGGGDARADTTAPAVAAEAAAVPVAAVTVNRRDVPVVVRATGTFMPDESSDVAAPGPRAGSQDTS